jgi:outer membrane receptor protein involved in Fe transport
MRGIWSGALVLSLASIPAAQAGAPPETVVVTGETPQTQVLIDRKVYPVANTIQSTFGTAADVLNNIPSVTVDSDGNVSLRNDGNVTILIDGKPSAQFSGSTGGTSILELPANDIDRIEVMTSPPASIKASGSGGVINIVTKSHRKAGFSGVLRGSAGLEGRFVTGADLAYNEGAISSSLGIGFRQDVRDRRTTDSRIVTDPATALETASGERVNEKVRRLVPSAKGSLDYAIDADQTVGVSFSYRNLIGVRDFLQTNSSGPVARPVFSLSERASRGREWDTYADQNVHYDRTLGADETLSLSIVRTTKQEDENYAYENTFALPAAPPAFDTLRLGLDLQEIDATADYERDFAFGGKVKLGYDFDTNDNHFDNSGANIVAGVAIVDPSVTNSFRYRNHVNALYGEFIAPWGAWNLDAGLRYEANVASTLLVTGNLSGKNRDSGVYPSVHLKRTLGSWDLLANIDRRVTRPDAEALNPFIDFQDTSNLRAGNAGLLPQDTWLYEAGFDHSGQSVNFGATFYYRFDRNSVTDVIVPVSADVVLDTKENLPKAHSYGLELETDGKLGKQLGFSLSANVFGMQIDARALGAPGLQSTQGINLKASLDYRLTTADTIQTTFARTSGRLTPQGTLGPTDVLNIGVKHKLDTDTTLVATVSDLLNGQGQHRLVHTTDLQDNYLRLTYGRIVYVGIVYGFGAPLSEKSDQINYDE